MASFKTHLYAGVFVSGGTVLALQGVGLVAPGQTLALFGLGVAGSVLPDIDADLAAPGRAFFGVLGAALAFGWTLPLVGHYGTLELALVWFGLFLAVRFLLFETFARFTVHRGIWHSWLAVAFVTLAIATLAHRLGRLATLARSGCAHRLGAGGRTPGRRLVPRRAGLAAHLAALVTAAERPRPAAGRSACGTPLLP